MKKLYTVSRVAMMSIIAAGSYSGVQAQELDEIIVTATKRAESLQDVPVSVVATKGEDIAALGLTNAETVTANLPAITIAQNPISNFIFIRGIGTSGSNQGIEQSVSMFHDGIYMGRHQLSRAPFMDLERVEVLRGPQSILFGKNTIGGAVHVLAAKPTDTLDGRVSALYGTDDEVELSGHISGPLGDKVRARISGRYYEHGGYLDNVILDESGPNREDWTIRGQLEFDLSENLTVNAKWESSEFFQRQQSTQLATVNPFSAGAAGVNGINQALVALATGGDGTESYDDERAVINDGGLLLNQLTQLAPFSGIPGFAQLNGLPGFPDKEELSDNSMNVGTLTVDWDLGGHTLTAITGYAEYDYVDVCDCDFAALPLIQVDATEDYSQFSQEIRLASPVGETVDYIIGAYYQDSDLEYRSGESFGSALAYSQVGVPSPFLVPNLTRDYGLNQDQEMWAVFGSATYNVSEATRLTAGLRYFDETKVADHFLTKRFTGGWDYSPLLALPAGTVAFGNTAADYDTFLATFGTTDLGGGITPGFLTEAVYAGLLGTFEHDIRDRKRSEDAITWSVTAEHDFNEDIMGYATVATGVKGGGFDGRFLRTNNNPFFEYEEEKAISYEAGVKTTLMDGAMRFNAAGFFSTVKDYQVSIFDGATAFFVNNAGEVETMGIEIDMDWAASDNLTFGLSGSWLDATYSDFPNAPCWNSPALAAGGVTAATPNRGDCVFPAMGDTFRDATGDKNMFSPDFAFNANAEYRLPIGDSLEGALMVNLNYSDSYFAASDLDPVYALQPSFTKIDARLSLGQLDGGWEIAFLGKNLTDELTSSSTNDQPLVPGNGFAQTDRTRSFAVQGSYKFD